MEISMAKEVKGPKTESLTIRMDPKTRFMMDCIARIRGQTITTVIERSVAAAAAQETMTYRGKAITWQHLWDLSDGIRSLMMAEVPELFPTYQEEKRLKFAAEHAVFFYRKGQRDLFKDWNIDVIWPRIDEFVEMHEKLQITDYFATGKEMCAALREANIDPPQWPPSSTSEPTAARDDGVGQ
jgi:hypothetical protein